MRILAIETTCDETAASVIENLNDGFCVLTEVVASSALMHQKYGGIVPEVAAREQIKSITPVVNEALRDITINSIDAIAVSYGPGLMGSLLVGVETAKSLALVWNKPLIKVNHMEAHVAANWIIPDDQSKTPSLPAIGLIVSGGHTDLVLIRERNIWSWIGGTRDDAAGEAFDKAARILGLSYPGGPSIENAAKEFKGDFSKYTLPRPMIYEKNLEMSFSGLKAALGKTVENNTLNQDEINGLAKDFNTSVVDVLVKKTLMAMEQYDIRTLVVAGGVAANSQLRDSLSSHISKENLYFPELKYCGDNAAMVGAAALIKRDFVNIEDLFPNPGLMTV